MINLYPLPEFQHIRRYEQPRPAPGCSQHRGKHRGGRAFAVGPGDMDQPQAAAGVSQPVQKSCRPAGRLIPFQPQTGPGVNITYCLLKRLYPVHVNRPLHQNLLLIFISIAYFLPDCIILPKAGHILCVKISLYKPGGIWYNFFNDLELF